MTTAKKIFGRCAKAVNAKEITKIELNAHSKIKTAFSGKAKTSGARGKVRLIGNHNS